MENQVTGRSLLAQIISDLELPPLATDRLTQAFEAQLNAGLGTDRVLAAVVSQIPGVNQKAEEADIELGEFVSAAVAEATDKIEAGEGVELPDPPVDPEDPEDPKDPEIDGDTFKLTEALENLAEANADVAAKETEIKNFLKSTFANEDVKKELVAGETADDITGSGAGNTLDAAYTTTAGKVMDKASGGAAIGLSKSNTDAQNTTKIAAARADYEANVTTAQTAVNSAKTKLNASVEQKMDTAYAAKTTLETKHADAGVKGKTDGTDGAFNTAIKVADIHAGATTGTNSFVVQAAALKGKPDGIELDSSLSDGTEVEIVKAGDLIIGDVSADGKKLGTDFQVVASKDSSGKYVLNNKLAAVDGEYTLFGVTKIGTAELAALIAAANDSVNAEKAVTAAETALAAAIVDVWETQDSTVTLTNKKTFTELKGATVKVIDDTSKSNITIDWDGDAGGSTAAITDGTGSFKISDLNAYADAVNNATTGLAQREKELSEFDEAVAAWRAVEKLVKDHAELGEQKTALDKLVTEAEKAITNAEDADPAGLGINLVKDDGAGNIAFVAAKDDLYLFNPADNSAAVAEFTGKDKIYFGDSFTGGLSVIEDITKDNGDVGKLDIFAVQNGADTDLYIEEKTFAGNGSSNSADLVKITLTGVDAEDLSFADGFLTIA